MGAGAGTVIVGANNRRTNEGAQVVNGRLLVTTQGGGGGPTSDVNIAEVGGVAVGGASVPVNDAGGSITVDGAVTVSGTVSVTEPVSVDDNGGSLTVDGTVAVSNFPAVQPVDDNGGSLTVDGTVAVSNFPATQPVSGTVSVTEPVSVDDNGGSLTVDGTITDNTQVTENAVVAADPNLLPIAVERDDALATLSEADGDWGHLRMDSVGALWVRINTMASALTGGTGDGQPIQVAAIATPGTIIHTVPVNTRQQIYMNATNTSQTGRSFAVEFGGTGVPKSRIFFVPPESSITISNGDILVADGSTRVIRALCPTAANVLLITGYVKTV